jgi:hypothetical protein
MRTFKYGNVQDGLKVDNIIEMVDISRKKWKGHAGRTVEDRWPRLCLHGITI